MRRISRLLLLAAVGTVAMLAVPAVASAKHDDAARTRRTCTRWGTASNPAASCRTCRARRQRRHQLRPCLLGQPGLQRQLRRLPDPQEEVRATRKLISWTRCKGNQGDIVVWGDFLVRAWNTPAVTGATTATAQPVPTGFEGMHVFDISNLEDPELVGSVELSARPRGGHRRGCGSHTVDARARRGERACADLQRDLRREHGAAGRPAGLRLDRHHPGAARRSGARISQLNREPLEGGHAAHDNGVILGDVNKLAVASGHMSNVFAIGATRRGAAASTDPKLLYTIEEEGVCNTGRPALQRQLALGGLHLGRRGRRARLGAGWRRRSPSARRPIRP